MTRQQLTKTESLIYRSFIVAYLLFIAAVIGSIAYGMVNATITVDECGAKETTK